MIPRLVIAGGGPVGLALACACGGFEVRVLEASPAARAAASDDFETRVYALSPGTRAFLRDLGVWELLDAKRVAAVRRMEVFSDGGAKLAFSGRSSSALAWIVEAGRLAQALEQAAASHPNVTVVRGAHATAFGAGAEGSWAELAGGERLEASLLVGADGPDSRVRTVLGIETEERAYDETAIVANFATEKEHGEVARQWFRSDGVLAWLPLPGRRISIVWSAPRGVAEELSRLDAAHLQERVRDAGGAPLGELELISPVARFPLRLIDVPQPVAAGVALVGDAAHAVHPLAGQGINLGFQDARCLAEALAARSPLERPGDLRVLRRYARGRREDVTAMQFVTDRLDQLFSSQGAGAAALRNTGMRLAETQGWIKNALADRAMR